GPFSGVFARLQEVSYGRQRPDCETIGYVHRPGTDDSQTRRPGLVCSVFAGWQDLSYENFGPACSTRRIFVARGHGAGGADAKQVAKGKLAMLTNQLRALFTGLLILWFSSAALGSRPQEPPSKADAPLA